MWVSVAYFWVAAGNTVKKLHIDDCFHQEADGVGRTGRQERGQGNDTDNAANGQQQNNLPLSFIG